MSMNRETGEFNPIDNIVQRTFAEQAGFPIFKEGEEIIIKGEVFLLEKIDFKDHKLVLKSKNLQDRIDRMQTNRVRKIYDKLAEQMDNKQKNEEG